MYLSTPPTRLAKVHEGIICDLRLETLGQCLKVTYGNKGIIHHRQTLLTLLRRRLILYVGNRIIVGIRSAGIETAKVEIFVRRG